jgi:hypothetical protein
MLVFCNPEFQPALGPIFHASSIRNLTPVCKEVSRLFATSFSGGIANRC